jgi:hypothetical protein
MGQQSYRKTREGGRKFVVVVGLLTLMSKSASKFSLHGAKPFSNVTCNASSKLFVESSMHIKCLAL